MRHSKRHEKTISFLEEAKAHGSINPLFRKANWLNIIQQCQNRPAGITAKQWLAENDIHEKSYYYWLRKIRREACEQRNLPEVTRPSEVSFVEVPIKTSLITDPVQGIPTASAPAAVIRAGDLTLKLSNDISGVVS